MNLQDLKIESLLPNFLKDEETAIALCKTVQPSFIRAAKDNQRLLLFTNINILDEQVLDELAFEFHADLYDYSAGIEEKRAVLKESVRIHKFAGTAYAVKKALASVYKDASLIEWFENSPHEIPFTFKVRVKAPPVADAKSLTSLLNKITTVVNKAKNVRSHLAGITLYIPTTAPIYTAMHHTVATRISIAPYLPHDLVAPPSAASTGAFVKTGMRITIEPKLKPI